MVWCPRKCFGASRKYLAFPDPSAVIIDFLRLAFALLSLCFHSGSPRRIHLMMNAQRGPGPFFSEWAPLEQPGFIAIQAALASALEENFADVNVNIVECPDLR